MFGRNLDLSFRKVWLHHGVAKMAFSLVLVLTLDTLTIAS